MQVSQGYLGWNRRNCTESSATGIVAAGRALKREVTGLLKGQGHPNIIPFHGFWAQDNHLVMVMDQVAMGSVGTRGCMAPEIKTDQLDQPDSWYNGAAADAYSLGCMVHYIIEGKTPDRKGNTVDPQVWEDAHGFVSKLILRDVDKCMTIDHALEHRFLKSVEDQELQGKVKETDLPGRTPESSAMAAARPAQGVGETG
ncbi:hypothetical protein BGX33_000379 [Mortierella sp. NVP41]|nr:hypothetical protein BGX33_000379 [Mortierella sp. NVP41]